MALTDATSLNLGQLTNMEVAISSNNQLAEMIKATAKNYHTVDISMAMTNLGNVGEILKLAYAGSKGFPCSTSTLKILSRYQTMIKNTYVTSSSFVGACLKALQMHKLALVMAQKEKMDSALKMLEKCADLAKTMADECEKLVTEATELCKLSEEALLTAQNDENVSVKEKERIKQVMTDSKAKQAEMEIKTKQLNEQIEDYNKKMAELARKADDARKKEFVLSIISTVTAPLTKLIEIPGKVVSSIGEAATDVLNKNKAKVEVKTNDGGGQQQTNKASDVNNNTLASEVLAKQESEIMKLKADLHEKEREANGEIAKLGEVLKGLKGQDADLTASIASLEMAIKALGKVKTTFEQTKQFWLGVEKHCKALTDVSVMEELKDPAFKDEFIDELKMSGLSWLTLGKINYSAQLAISEVDKTTDNILSNLPTKIEALEFVKNDADRILETLINEVSAISQ